MKAVEVSRQRTAWRVAGAVVVGVGAWFGARSMHRLPRVAPVRTAEAPKTSIARSSVTCAIPEGARMAYDGSLDTDAALDASAVVAKGQTQGSSGGVRATQAQHRKDHTVFHLELEMLHAFAVGGGVLAAEVRRLESRVVSVDGGAEGPLATAPAGVGDAFRVRLDERCTITEFGWRPDANLDGAKQQQSVVAALSFQLPRANDGDRYLSDGFDPLGRYRALNALDETGVASRTTEYTHDFLHLVTDNETDAGAAAMNKTTASELVLDARDGHVVPSDGRWFQVLDRSVSFHLMGGHSNVGSLALHATARVAPLDPGWSVVREGEWTWGLLLDAAEDKARKSTAALDPEAAAKLDGLSLDDVLTRVNALMRSKSGNPAEYVPILTEWLRRHPDGVAALVDRIKANAYDNDPQLQAVLFHGLSSANTDAARSGLMSILDSRSVAGGRRIDAAQALALMKDPPPAFLDDLVRSCADRTRSALERHTMTLTVGMFAASNAKTHPVEAARARGDLRTALKVNQGDEGSLAAALRGAGNASSDELTPDIARYLGDTRPHIRGTAADALRNTSSAKGIPVVDKAYASESDPSVRTFLVESATSMIKRDNALPPPDLREAVDARAQAATDPGEFSQSVAFLGASSAAGDTTSQSEIQALFDAERARGTAADAERLKVLGRYVGTRLSPSSP